MEIELVPEACAAEQAAAGGALASAALDAETSSLWWRAGLDEALGRAPSGPPRPSAYDAAPPPRSTRGATRA